jgi:hypothetical protein
MRLKRSIPFLLVILLGGSGCSALNHLDELTVMGDYSREKDNQHRLVKATNDHYDALIKIIVQGHISNYKDKSSFLSSFGDPIIKKDLSDGKERWLYRYAIFRLAKDKVYVYFDHSGKMIKWERLPCSSLY